ncbi:MAG TPA: glycosyltransferase family 39 protein [Polyangiaceae bacterium]|nr:glycosyltransferase family 39 protein [Polyangiaceae bacterium]
MTSDAPEPPRARARLSGWLVGLALSFVALTLVVPMVRSGLWDPFELRSIELARRIALGLFGAHGFELPGVPNALPSRGEVDRGELPFTSMALGLRLFGLHAWAARLPLVVIALAGLVATYLVVRRLSDRSAAVASVLVLGTMPLYFLHARTLLGDIVTMAAAAVAMAGLALALFDSAGPKARVGALGLALVGLAAGLMTRGLLLGVSVPLLGAGLAWLILALGGALERDRTRTALGSVVVLLGVACAGLGVRLLGRALDEPERYFLWLGFGISRAARPPTFDAVIGQLGHALFPWSALVPVALARVALLPSSLSPAERARESGLRLTVVVTAGVGLAAFGGVAPAAGVLPFSPVASLAVLVALSLRDIDRTAAPSRAAGMTGVALLVLLLADFVNLPDKTLVAFGVEGARFPESFQGRGWLFFAAASTALGFFAALLEAGDEDTVAFDRRAYLGWVSTLRDLWNGNLLFGVCVVEAALLGFFAFDLLGERIPALARFAFTGEGRESLRFAWLALPLVLSLPWLTLALRDAVRWVTRPRARDARLLPSRGLIAVLGGVAGAAGLSVGYYPALAAQLSPQGTFDVFHRLARPGDELALLGTSSASAPYAAGRSVVSLGGVDSAFDWLTAGSARRFLVLKAESLNGLNSRFRARAKAQGNLPILDGRSSEVLLASDRLLPGEHSENPLDRYLLASAPHPTRPLDANLDDALDVLGWDVTDLDQHPVRALVPGRRYEFVIYFRVVARLTGTWETFVHIDGFQRRFNADHPTLEGHYPFALWNVGDLIADRHPFALEPNFTRGSYHVYFGLYTGARRLTVRRGSATDDRIDAGTVDVE